MASDNQSEVSKCLVFGIDDLWFAIFKRLPVKSLCRFRCVCKSWNSLIASPSFIAQHYSFVTSAAEITPATKKSYLLLNGWRHNQVPFALYHPQEPLLQQITYLAPPFPVKRVCIVDVILGVVCLMSSFDCLKEPAILWNPSVNKYFRIPWSPFLDGNNRTCQIVGFGFDGSKNDFKVVRASFPFLGGFWLPVYQVFSLQDGVWRDVAADNVGLHEIITYNSCFVNGTIHWIARAQKDGIVTGALLLFDCKHAELSMIELPQELVPTSFIKGRVVVLKYDGKLAVLDYSSRVGAFEMWVMEKYGVVSSWNKLFRIDREYVTLRNIVMRREDGDALTYDDVSYVDPANPNKKTKKRLRSRKLYLPINAYTYDESLFLIEQKSQEAEDIMHIY